MVLQGENIVSGGSSVPIGTISSFSGNTPPIGQILCNGRALSRTEYALLFAVIGTTYGAGDGVTTFNIPDFTAEPIMYIIKVSNHGILPVNAIDDLQTTNANTWSAEHIANLTRTLRISADGTLSAYPDGSRLRLANISASVRSLTMPTGYTMNGQSSFTIAPDTILEFEVIGTAWKCVSNKWELLWENPNLAPIEAFDITLNASLTQFKNYKILFCVHFSVNRFDSVIAKSNNDIYLSFLTTGIYWRYTNIVSATVIHCDSGMKTTVLNTGDQIEANACIPYAIYGMK